MNAPEEPLKSDLAKPHSEASIPQVLRQVQTVLSDDLFNGTREIQISHNDDIYRLCITKNDKLILQK